MIFYFSFLLYFYYITFNIQYFDLFIFEKQLKLLRIIRFLILNIL